MGHEKEESLISEADHDTARDQRGPGFIDKRTLRKSNWVEPVPSYSAEQIRSFRERHRLSQPAMAAIFNISLTTVQKWEIGNRRPGGSSLKLLSLFDHKGLEGLMTK